MVSVLVSSGGKLGILVGVFVIASSEVVIPGDSEVEIGAVSPALVLGRVVPPLGSPTVGTVVEAEELPILSVPNLEASEMFAD